MIGIGIDLHPFMSCK